MSVTEPMPSHRGHMPPVTVKTRFSVLPAPFSTVIDPTAADRRDVEGEGVGRADVRLAEAAEQHPQHRVGVGRRADRRAGVGAHPLLVDDDRGRQPFQDVDLGPAQRRHESLQERAVGLVDQPLRLRRDGAEHQRRLARSRDAGEHGQPPLGDLDADVLQVVLAGALDADQVVAVCGVLAGGGHVRDHVIEYRRARGTADRCSSLGLNYRASSARLATSCRRRAYTDDGTARLAACSSAGAAYFNSARASALSISLRASTVYQNGNLRH